MTAPLADAMSLTARAWLDGNNQYLAASIHWLRLRLHAFSPAHAPARPELDAEIQQAHAAREAAAETTPAPALLLLAERFGLSDFERDILLLCAAAELDPSAAALFAAAQGNTACTYPTFALAMTVLGEPAWDALSPYRPLRQARLIATTAGGGPLTASPLRADERIINYLKGVNALDERLAQTLAAPSRLPLPALSASQEATAGEILERVRSSARTGVVPSIMLLGPDSDSKQAIARFVCASIDRELHRISLEALHEQRGDLDTFTRLWQRESALLPIALYVDAEALDGAATDAGHTLQTFIARGAGLLFVGMRESSLSISASHALEIRKPTLSEQSAAWQRQLGGEGAVEARAGARLLAGQFDLSIDEIERAANVASTASAEGSRAERAWAACRKLTQPRLDALAQRLEPKATWDDLVLSDEALKLLHQIAGQVRARYQVYEDWGYAKRMTRGSGITALFAGESGTGKTMAAEVIANELRLNLYRIDLSAVVSKYIGETEKNLRRLFDSAERGGAILLFDEADALFGKRSEVKDSHDRYANIEINYLLQRMEAFSGIAILATNMKGALDQAFMRRLRFIVTFPFPGITERERMWRKAFPNELPRDGLDYERLARFSLSGGNIHSIALNAAFVAAQREGTLSQGILLSAVRTELRKLDKAISEADFR